MVGIAERNVVKTSEQIELKVALECNPDSVHDAWVAYQWAIAALRKKEDSNAALTGSEAVPSNGVVGAAT